MLTPDQRSTLKNTCRDIQHLMDNIYGYCSQLDQLDATNWTVSTDTAGIKTTTIYDDIQKKQAEQTYLDLKDKLILLMGQIP